MTDPAVTMTIADVRRDVRTLLESHDVPELGAAIMRLQYWLDATEVDADATAIFAAPAESKPA